MCGGALSYGSWNACFSSNSLPKEEPDLEDVFLVHHGVVSSVLSCCAKVDAADSQMTPLIWAS